MIGKLKAKYRNWRNRVISTALSMVFAAAPFACLGNIQVGANEDDPGFTIEETNYGLMENIQDGTILHCFDWKYTDIKAELPNIAAAGFTSVQTSPAQPGGGKDSSIWWWLYQPLGFFVGANDLGTKEELQQLCTEAETYGIKVIVDVVSNHLAGDHTYITNDFKDSKYWRSGGSYSGREEDIYKDLGMPDIKSEDPDVYTAVKAYIQELKDIGVDGIRWDTAKHIQLPSDDECRFWQEVTSVEGMYHYGEILGLPKNNDYNKMKEYTQYMSVTDSTYSTDLRNAFNSSTVPTTSGSLAYHDISTNKLVYWAESHDTWSNNKDWGFSNEMPQNVIDKAYAIAASRNGATALYFSRPEYRFKDNIKAGVKGSTHFTSPEVAAVNHFHNAMAGTTDYYSKNDTAAAVCRPKGAVVVKAQGGSAYVSVPNGGSTTAVGEYIDEITGNIWTVNSSYISGTIGESGIAVLYNRTDYPYITPLSSSGSSGSQTTGTLYFNNTAYNWEDVNAYVYDGMGTDKNADWPGAEMSYDSNTGLYKLENVNTYNGNARVIFTQKNSTENRYPADGIPGMDFPEGDMILTKSGNIVVWDKYTPASAPASGSVSATADESSFTDTLTVTLHAQGVTNPIYMTSDSGYGSFTDGQTITIGNENTRAGDFKVAVKGLKSDGTMASSVSTFTKIGTPVTLYLNIAVKPWTDCNNFAAWVWNDGNDGRFIDMTKTADNIYSVIIPAGSENKIIFCAMRGTASWDNKVAQTVDLDIPGSSNYYTLSGIDQTEQTKYSGTWSVYTPPAAHTHTYGEPTWIWETDYSGASAKFSCTGCDDEKYENAAMSVSFVSNIRVHTASVTFDGVEYTDTQYEPMVVELDQSGAVDYQLEHPETMKKLYECFIQNSTFTDDEEVDVSSCQIPASESNYVTKALVNLFPEADVIDKAKGWTIYSNGDKITSIAFHDYTMTKDEFTALSVSFNEKVQWYLSQINNSWNDFTKALVLHDLLVLNNYYQIQSDTQYSSNYTFMVDGWGRCENYAEIYAYLLARLGIKSEIVSGNANGAHEWINICLGGKWYAVDITFDDPIVNGADRPHKVSHKYFLLSDSSLAAASTPHTDYNTYYQTDSEYGSYTNLHGNENPVFEANGSLWTLYTKKDTTQTSFSNGVLAVYNSNDDTYTDFDSVNILPIRDRWSAGNSDYYTNNYSGLAQYNGKLYINGEHNVYAFDPTISSVETLIQYNDHQLYGIYIKDGKLYGLSADRPNNAAQVELYNLNTLPQTYTITWKNDNGTIIDTTTVAAGETPVHADPTKAATAQYTYTFAGWTPEITAANQDTTYTATYTSTVNQYTITWNMDDGTLIDTTTVAYGQTPTHEDPVKASDAQYTYTFSGWSPSVTAVTGNAVYTAQFTSTPIQVENITVTAYNFAGWDNMYVYYWGTGNDPVWPGTEITNSNDNFIYTAVIPSNAAGVKFSDGTQFNQSTGATPNSYKSDNIQTGIENGVRWAISKPVSEGNTCRVTVVNNYYLVGSMNNWSISNLVLQPVKNSDNAEEYRLTTELAANAEFKVKSGDSTWYPDGGNNNYQVTTEGTYTIRFRPNGDGGEGWHYNVLKAELHCTVTFYSDNGSSIDPQTVISGNTAVQPESPTRTNYTFLGWYNGDTQYDFNTPVTADITLTAHWQENTVPINYTDINGITTKLTDAGIVTFEGTSLELPATPYLDGYDFTGWKVNDTDHTTADAVKNAVETLVKAGTAVTVQPVYTKKTETYHVKIGNGHFKGSADSEGNYNPSTQLYAVADDGAEGQIFDHWEVIDNNTLERISIVGFGQTYAFRMPTKNITLSAVYVTKEEDKTSKVGTAYIESVLKPADNKLSFVAILSVPDGATMKRAGIVAFKSSDITDGHSTPTIDYARFKRYNDTTCQNYTTFKYTWTKGNITNQDDEWCVCAYLLYTDTNNTDHTVYGNMVKAKLSDFT